MGRVLVCVVLGVAACASTHKVAWTVDELRQELARRVPDVPPEDLVVPFELSLEQTERALEFARYEPSYLRRAQRLLDALRLSDDLSLEYVPAETSTARQTLAARRGNCLSLASVVVGMARAAGLDAYYVDLSRQMEEMVRHPDLMVRSGHVLAVIMTRDGYAALNVTGRNLRAASHWRPMTDLEATAHYYNNRGYELIHFSEARGLPVPWELVHEHFRRATLIDPEFARAFNNLGVAAMRLGRPIDAERHYLAAIDRAPELPSPYANLGTHYLAQSRFVEAEAMLRRAFDLDETAPVAHKLGVALHELGRTEEAIEVLERGRSLGSENASELLSQIIAGDSQLDDSHR